MLTTRVITREYDEQGRLVREIETITTMPDPYVPVTWQPAWWQAPVITCGPGAQAVYC